MPSRSEEKCERRWKGHSYLQVTIIQPDEVTDRVEDTDKVSLQRFRSTESLSVLCSLSQLLLQCF